MISTKGTLRLAVFMGEHIQDRWAPVKNNDFALEQKSLVYPHTVNPLHSIEISAPDVSIFTSLPLSIKRDAPLRDNLIH